MKRLLLLLLVVGVFLSWSQPIQAQEDKFYFSLFGGFNHVFKYGSDNDYEQGVNDFPVTPSHYTGSFGLSLGYLVYRGFGIEMDIRYHLSSPITLEDPSDGDTITYDTAKHYTATLNVIYQFSGEKLRPYILAGGGLDKLVDVEEITVVSEYGYDVIISPPEKTSDFVFVLGGGLMYFVSEHFGVRLDARYMNIIKTDDHPVIHNLNITGGIALRF